MRLPESCLATSLQRAPFEEEVEKGRCQKTPHPSLVCCQLSNILDTSSIPTLTPTQSHQSLVLVNEAHSFGLRLRPPPPPGAQLGPAERWWVL